MVGTSHDPDTSGPGAGTTPGFWPSGDAGKILDSRGFVIPVLGAGIGLGPGGLPSTQDIARHVAAAFPRAGGYRDPQHRWAQGGRGLRQAAGRSRKRLLAWAA